MTDADDGVEVVAAFLRPHEAGLLRSLLEAEGIDVAVRDEALPALNPLLENAVGGVKLAVPRADAARARAILAAAEAPPADGEIPEEEWSRGATPPPAGPAPAGDGPLEATARRAIAAAVLGFLLLPPLLHLWSLAQVARFLATPGRASSRARGQVAAALALDALGVVAGVAFVQLLRGR